MRSGSRGEGERIVATSDFSGLVSSACALASAAAIAPMVSLDRCIAVLRTQKIETDCARLRAFGPDAVTRCLLSVLWHQGLELRLCVLMSRKAERVAQKSPANSAQELDS